MRAWLEGNTLHISAPLGQGAASRSGRTMIVASTHGNRAIEDAEYEGRPVYFNLNVLQFVEEVSPPSPAEAATVEIPRVGRPRKKVA